MRLTRPLLLLALAALLAPRIEASRTGVWESNPPAAALTTTNAASLLAPLAPARSLESTVADADLVEPRSFDLGDVVLVDNFRETGFRLGLADVVEPPTLRGPPALAEDPRQAFELCDPENRIRGLDLLPPFRVGASPSLSLWPRQACGFSCREVVSDSRYDPWGLCLGNLPCPHWLSKAADDLSTFYDSKAGHAVVAIGKGAAVVGGAGAVALGAVAAAPVIAIYAGATEATVAVAGSITATTVTAAGFGAAAHQAVSSSIKRYGEEGVVGRAIGLGISDATGATGIAEGITGLDTSTGARLSSREAGDRLGAGTVRAAATTLLAASAARIATSRAQDPDTLFARSSPRKGAEQAAMNAAPKGPNGEPMCETCGSVLPKQITLGSRVVRGFQMDHFRLTFAERMQVLMQRPVWPARPTVLDYNNMGLRPLCAPCNLGHVWEGQIGPFATGANPGLSGIPLDPANAGVTAIGGGVVGQAATDD